MLGDGENSETVDWGVKTGIQPTQEEITCKSLELFRKNHLGGKKFAQVLDIFRKKLKGLWAKTKL